MKRFNNCSWRWFDPKPTRSPHQYRCQVKDHFTRPRCYRKGATIRYGKIDTDANRQSPVILDNITDEMSIWNTEIFGPIVAIRVFSTEEEAIQMANDTEHGLASYFYSSNAQRQWTLPSKLQYGMVGVNTGKISTPLAPFGGIKQSGMGREGSDEGLNSYLETQYVNTTLM